MQIGDLARRSGASPRSLRHYEAAGLLVPHRRVNGYREYLDDAVDRVIRIKALLAAGFSVAEIGPLLSCVIDARPTLVRCERTAAAVDDAIAGIDSRIDDLLARRTLLVHALAGGPRTGQPVTPA